MRIVTVVGNRPQFVKAAAVSRRLREAHARVRDAGRQAGSTRIQVTPHLPADVLGLYVYLPTVVR